MTKRLRPLALCGVLFLLLAGAHAQTALCTAIPSPCVTLGGKVAAANGLAAIDYTLTFAPTQMMVVAGSGTIVPTSTTCATTIDGSVVGVLDPLTTTSISPQFSGTLPAATYYVQYTWVDSAGHETLPSTEQQVQLSSTGGLVIANPASTLQNGVTGMKVYISTTSGFETLQGTASGTASFTQSVPLVVGAAVPSTNATVCQQVASDVAWPSGTGYRVAMTDPSGNSAPGYPMQWQLTGAGTTVNLSNGLPYYHGVVYYPSPILATPSNKQNQSITGGLAVLGGITSTPSINLSVRFCGSPVSIVDLGAQCNTAMSVVTAAAGGEVIITGSGTANYSTGLVMQPNVRLHGTSKSTAINFTGTGNAISASGVPNIEIDHLTISNGVNQTGGFLPGQNAIRFDNVSGYSLHDLLITPVSGAYGIYAWGSSNGQVYNNEVGPYTYCGICIGLNSSGNRIHDNYVHNVTTTVANLGYGISGATSAENGTQQGVYANNSLIYNNTVKYVPHWEALDLHGGTNHAIFDNYVENAFVCILAALQYSGINSPSVPTMQNTHIWHNTCIQNNGVTPSSTTPAADANGRSIIAQGDSFPQKADAFWVEENDISGYGATSSALASTAGVIDMRETTNSHVLRNHCRNWNQYCVYLSDNIGGEVADNVIYNMIDKKAASSAGVYPDQGNYSFDVSGNHGVWDTTHQPNYIVRANAGSNNITMSRMNWADNTPLTSNYVLFAPCCYSGTALPGATSKLIYKGGDKFWDVFGRPWWSGATNNVDGYYSQDSTTVISTCNMTIGLATLTGCTGGSGGATYYYYFPIGMHVAVAGAVVSGKVIGYTSTGTSVTGVVLDSNATGTVTGANVTLLSSGIGPNAGIVSQQYLTEWESMGSLDPVQGQHWTADNSFTNGSDFGFEFGANNGGFYGTYNVKQTTRNTDLWTQKNVAQPSYMMDSTNAGIQAWFAASGTCAGVTKAVCFGATPLFSLTNLGLAISGHLNQSATNKFAGTIAVSASTTGSTNFGAAFSSAPVCTITPITDPTAVGVYWVTSSTTAVTATVKTSGTITFNYICVGNPN